jgi:hypothetical protein
VSAPEQMATPAEVAAVLRVQVETLATWRWLGKGPAFHKVGRYVRYCWADIREYQAKQRRAAA